DGAGAPALAQVAVVERGRADPVPEEGRSQEQESRRLIAALAAAETSHMGAGRFTSWFEANRDGLMTGVLVGLVLVGLMLLLRCLGERSIRRDPLGMGWRTVFGRVLAKTSVAFMILAAAD